MIEEFDKTISSDLSIKEEEKYLLYYYALNSSTLQFMDTLYFTKLSMTCMFVFNHSQTNGKLGT